MKIKASMERPVDGLCASSIAWGQRLRSDSHDPGYEHLYFKVMKIRGDWNAKSLELYYTSFKSFSNKSSRIFGFERSKFWNLSSHYAHLWKMMKIRGDQNAKSLIFYYTNFKSFSNKSSRIFWFETTQFLNLLSHDAHLRTSTKWWK